MHWQCPNCDRKAKSVKELREIGCNCKAEPISFLDPEDHAKSNKSKEQEKDERTPSKKCYDFAMSKIQKLVISQNNSDEVYAIVETNSHVETLYLESPRARHWLNNEYSKYFDTNEIHSHDFFNTVLGAIIARAQMNETPRVKIYNRVAQLDNEIWYDLGTPDWQAIRITKDGIKTVKLDADSPVFRRTQSMQQQVMPQAGRDNALDELADLLHIIPKDRLVFKIHVVVLFLEKYPIPMMVFDGTAGSLKTTATATIKRIVDPAGREKEDNVSMMAEKRDDLIIQIYNRYLSSFDNVSKVDLKTSDVLCRAITGSSNPKRKLFTNNDEAIQNFKRKIVLNGIVPTLEYPDLQTRLLSYARERIEETDRITEQEFSQKLEALLPVVLGKIFITLCEAIRKYPDVKDRIKPRTRMSDFEVWGETISRILGNNENEFLNSYYEKLKEGSISSHDTYPLVTTIQSFMDGKEEYENTVANLYHHLVTKAEDTGINLQSKYIRFPRSPNKLKKDLVIVDSLLRNIGFIVETYHYTKNDGKFTKNTSIVKITRKDAQTPLFPQVSSPSSPSSPPPDLGTKIGEDTGEDTRPQNTVPSPENTDFTHEIKAGEGGEGGEHTPEKSGGSKQFICETHNAGPFPLDATSKSSGSILEFHQKLGCQIRYVEEGENVDH